MTPELFLETVRPHFRVMPGKLTFDLGPTDWYELRFSHEAFDCHGVVVVPVRDLSDPRVMENKLVEAAGLAEVLAETILAGHAPYRAGFPKEQHGEAGR